MSIKITPNCFKDHHVSYGWVGADSMPQFQHLAISDPAHLTFGYAQKPLTTRSGMVIGGGIVYPEVRLIQLSPLTTKHSLEDWAQAIRYRAACLVGRVAELDAPGLVVEVASSGEGKAESAYIDLHQTVFEAIHDAADSVALPTAIRFTVRDRRDRGSAIELRQGRQLDGVWSLLEAAADSGVDFFSAESSAGRTVNDDAIQSCDIAKSIFAHCVLGAQDMVMLWDRIVPIAERSGGNAAGDAPCFLANVALGASQAHRIPRVFGAVVRALSTVRSLVAFECGATGPSKSCCYENPILKAITGFPVAGGVNAPDCVDSACFGHACLSVVDLLADSRALLSHSEEFALDVARLDRVVFDTRLINESLGDGPVASSMFQRWLLQADIYREPQALVLAPESAVSIAGAIVDAPNRYRAGVAAALAAVDILVQAHQDRRLVLSHEELPWLDSIRNHLYDLPESESDFIEQMIDEVDTSTLHLNKYELN